MTEGRHSVRHRVTVQGQCRSAAGQRTDVSVVDLSDTGCRLFSPRTRLKIGETITLKIEALGPFVATVIWSVDGLFGVRFANRLYGPIFDHIRTVLDTPRWRPPAP